MTQPFGFSTKRYDPQTGLVYYGHRYYSPAIGRWTTRDPLGEAGGLNLYAFVGNNPVNWVDPWGLQTLPGHHPPGWTEDWRWDWGSRGNSGKHWWDPEGGEWRWHPPDKHHPKGHWDYNPWDSWNSKWRNVPGKPPPPSAPKKPWWTKLPPLIPDPIIIIIHPCVFEPWHSWCPQNPYNKSPDA